MSDDNTTNTPEEMPDATSASAGVPADAPNNEDAGSAAESAASADSDLVNDDAMAAAMRTAIDGPQNAAAPKEEPVADGSAADSNQDSDAGESPAASAPGDGDTPPTASDTTVPAGAVPFATPDLSGIQSQRKSASIDLLDDVELDVKIELGRAEMYIEDVLALGPGSVVKLDKAAGDPVDIFVNERLVARGEVLVLNDNFCVRIKRHPESHSGSLSSRRARICHGWRKLQS